jgi:hypothetical protein
MAGEKSDHRNLEIDVPPQSGCSLSTVNCQPLLPFRPSKPPQQHRGRQVKKETAGVVEEAVGDEFCVHIDGEEAQCQYACAPQRYARPRPVYCNS